MNGPGSRERDYLRGEADYPSRFVPWDQERNLQTLLVLQAAGEVRVGPLLTTASHSTKPPKRLKSPSTSPPKPSAWGWSMFSGRKLIDTTPFP